MPTFIPARGRTLHLAGVCVNRIGTVGLMAYLAMMSVRLVEMRPVLKSSGSLYLHCDPIASHYLKTIMDGIFGRANFMNEITWKRTTTKSDFAQGARNWPRIHDTILYYAKDARSLEVFKQPFAEYEDSYVDSKYNKIDADGRRYMLDNLTAPGAGTRGHPKYELLGVTRYWRYGQEKMKSLLEAGRIIQPSPGAVPRYKRMLDEMKGIAIGDCWTDINAINSQAVERMGYPTQKPVALLERIISASSLSDATILDPFCGCGTTVDAAQRLGRQWIGIDIAVHAIKVIEARLTREFKGAVTYSLEGLPRDFASAVKLAEPDKYQFQWWANYLFDPHALREHKRGADRGVDGEIFFPNGPGRPWGRMLTSVKGGGHVGPGMVRDFCHVIDREKATMGLFVCLYPPTRAMTTEAAGLGFAETVHGRIPRLQIVALEEWFAGRRPSLPPLQHLPSAALTASVKGKTAKRPDPNAPELPFTFTGGKAGAEKGVLYINPRMVSDVA
jgi:adenine specific DNA methylase Mod